MKQIVAVLSALLMLLTFTACTSDTPSSLPLDGEGTPYSFHYGTTTITPHAKAAPVLAALGGDYQYNESASCAFEGLDKVYTYSDIELYTYPVEGEDYVLSVAFRSDAVATDKGITIGSTHAEVLDAYGSSATVKGSAEDGEITYAAANTYLKFLTRGGSVYYIEYGAVTD